MRFKKIITSTLALSMILLLTISLPVFAKTPKQPTNIPIPQYSPIPEVKYISEPQQEIVADNGTVVVQWSSYLHQNIIREGIAKVKRDHPELAYRLTRILPYGAPGSTPYKSAETLLIEGATWPDSYEQDYGTGWPFSGHFYDPSTGCNYAGYTSPTAYTRFNNHYYNGLNASTARVAFNELAYSLHYLGDLNTPHHAANVPAGINGDTTHVNFETFADNNYSYYTTSWSGDYWLANSNMLDIANYYSRNAKSYITQAKYSNDSTKGIAVENTLPYAQSGAAGMIYRFLISSNW
ncbi:MAG: zinc dependent phospholipase C family protein [Desulfitobacteriaceae bacterium]